MISSEDDIVAQNILNRTFFAAWKEREYVRDQKYLNYSNLEIQVNPHCDLACKYCYYAKYSEQLYPSDIAGKSNILKNLDILLSWLKKNRLFPKIDLFSGELYFQSLGWEVTKRVIDWHYDVGISGTVIVPTNFSFLFNDEQKMEDLIAYAKDKDVQLILSCSVDGKYCDENRPFRDGKVRDDAYYDRMFAFCKRQGFGFHPMVYSEKIERWKDNFLWFQENYAKHDIPWFNLYLLEVRNVEWTKDQLNAFYTFIRFLFKWAFQKSGVSASEFPMFVHKFKLFNMLNIFSTVGRGTGCSVQSTMQLRLGDLTTSICHRAAYKPHNLWKFEVENDEIAGVKVINLPLMISMYSMENRNLPFCEQCLIKYLCSGQCLGSMYEVTGDPFMPIPVVCALEHIKIKAILDAAKETGTLPYFYAFVMQAKKSSIEWVGKVTGVNYMEA